MRSKSAIFGRTCDANRAFHCTSRRSWDPPTWAHVKASRAEDVRDLYQCLDASGNTNPERYSRSIGTKVPNEKGTFSPLIGRFAERRTSGESMGFTTIVSFAKDGPCEKKMQRGRWHKMGGVEQGKRGAGTERGCFVVTIRARS